MYEPHLLQPQAYQDFLERLGKLSPSSQALWGKMDVAQMLAHVATFLEIATSDKKVTQMLLGRIFGPFGKRQILTTGIPKNSPTIPSIKISGQRNFQEEKERALCGLARFYKGGEAGITRQPHQFWGRLTPNEWARLQYVHMDHHFKQFGV
jgi:Protein of unknown function (DUF1569)